MRISFIALLILSLSGCGRSAPSADVDDSDILYSGTPAPGAPNTPNSILGLWKAQSVTGDIAHEYRISFFPEKAFIANRCKFKFEETITVSTEIPMDYGATPAKLRESKYVEKKGAPGFCFIDAKEKQFRFKLSGRSLAVEGLTDETLNFTKIRD